MYYAYCLTYFSPPSSRCQHTKYFVEEAQCLAVGRLGEYLRAVEQVLGCSRAHGFTCSDAFGIVGEGKFFILFQPL